MCSGNGFGSGRVRWLHTVASAAVWRPTTRCALVARRMVVWQARQTWNGASIAVTVRWRWSAGGNLVGRVASTTSPPPPLSSLLYGNSELCLLDLRMVMSGQGHQLHATSTLKTSGQLRQDGRYSLASLEASAVPLSLFGVKIHRVKI
jgi:hypothetical protein